MKRQASLLKQMVLVVLLLAATVALWFGQEQISKVFAALRPADQHGASPSRGGSKELPVVVAQVQQRTNDAIIEAIATARASRSVMLYSEVTGKIDYLGARAGKTVKTGEVILRLETQAAEIAVKLGKVKVVEAERLLARAQDLLASKVKAQANVDDARTALDRYRLELARAEDALSKRIIRAPFDGVIGIPKVETGDHVSSSTAIATMDDRSELLVEVDVPELHLARIEVGQQIIARTPSYPATDFNGRIEAIDSRVDPTSRNVVFRARLPNKDDLLRPGMSFAVEVLIPGKPYPTVPELALQWGKGKSFVWRINGSKVERVAVRSIRRLNSFILVDGDLAAGDIVVVEGVQRLRPGRAVSFTAPNTSKPVS